MGYQGLGVDEGLPEGRMQLGGVPRTALGPPGIVPFSWEDSRKCFDLVELSVMRGAAGVVSVPWVLVFSPSR